MSGNVDTRTELVPASGVVNLGNANFIFIISATGNIALKLTRSGLARGTSQENYTGQLGALQIGRVQRWDFATMTAAPGVAVTFMYGYSDFREDFTLFNQQIATISGTVPVLQQPFATVNDTPVAAAPNAAQTAIFPANLARRAISFSLPSNSVVPPATVFARKAGGANNLYEIQPGVVYNEVATYGIDIRNDSGGALNFMIDEVQ